MSDFQIETIGNGDHDLVITDNDFVLVGETEDTWQTEVVQRVRFALGTWYAESAFDRSVGFPYLEGVFGRQPLEGIQAIVTQEILDVDGVDGIEDGPTLDLDRTARVLTISVTIKGTGFVVPVVTTLEAA